MSQKYTHPTPLTESYISSGSLKQKPQKRKKLEDEGHENKFIDARESRKILKVRQELAEEEQLHYEKKLTTDQKNLVQAEINNTALDLAENSSDAYDDDDDGWEDDAEDQLHEEEIDPVDLDTFDRFNSLSNDNILEEHQTTLENRAGSKLADLIVQKIADWEATQANEGEARTVERGDQSDDGVQVPPKVVEVYSKVGLILSRYKSGQLPKPFKVLPSMESWETLIAFTKPESWTANACYEATKLFISGKSRIAQAFLSNIMLDRVRDDIHETKKLNVHLYKALKKALFKPAAFFKGFLFPLLESGTCTLREAHIISSILVRVSVPVLHSAAALHRLCDIAVEQMNSSSEAGGATNFFIRVLLDKKYALPYKVIDSLVFHFLRFRSGVSERGTKEMDLAEGKSRRDDKLPVIWHQGLLAFAQRYKNDISEDQREALLDLLTVKGHKAIGPEIRRELLEGRGRGAPFQPTVPLNDDTMIMDVTK